MIRKSFTASSKRGGYLDLLHDPFFILVDFDGETLNENELSTSTVAGLDGDMLNNAQAMPRRGALEFRIKNGVSVEEAKRHIMQVAKPKQELVLRMVYSDREIELVGTVQAITMPRYQNGISLFVTLHCSQPFWEDVNEIIKTLTGVDNLHYFTTDPTDMLYFPEEGTPFGVYDFAREQSYYNHGDVAVGMEIRITAAAAVTNPVIYAESGAYIGVNATMEAHDVISITTHRGNKDILKNGESILDSIKEGSTWLQLETGMNHFNAASDDEALDNMYFELIYKQRYV